MGHTTIVFMRPSPPRDKFFCNEIALNKPFSIESLIRVTREDLRNLRLRGDQDALFILFKRTFHDNRLRLLDLFAGAGGLSHGLVRGGCIQAVTAVEISPSASMTLRYTQL